jgi:hypothetical protein
LWTAPPPFVTRLQTALRIVLEELAGLTVADDNQQDRIWSGGNLRMIE